MAIRVQKLKQNDQLLEVFYVKEDAASSTVSVKLYVSLTDVTGNYVLLKDYVANKPGNGNNVEMRVSLSELEAVIPGANFTSTPIYLRLTEVDKVGVETALSSSPSKYVGVEGYNPSAEQDSPSQNNHNYSFSMAALGWVRNQSTASGAVAVSGSALHEDNIVIDRTIVGGNVTEELIYRASDPSGAPAKRIVYTAPFSTDGKATKVEYLDSTKP